jgi:hypothetical protein
VSGDHCPTCGASVVVVSGGEGTSHYRPLHDDEFIADLVQHRARELAEGMYRAAQVTGGQVPPAGPGGPNTMTVGMGVWREGQLIYAVRVDESGGIVIDPLRDVRADGDLSWTLRDGDRIVPMSLTPA